MLRSIVFKKDFRVFKQNTKIQFRPGVNLLVGDQGTGKSSVLELLMNRKNQRDAVLTIDCDYTEIIFHDFEHDNPRISKGYFRDDLSIEMQVGIKFCSHGEFVMAFLKTMKEKGMLFLLDEPDQALSPRSCYKISKLFQEVVENGSQLVASVHNPIVISSQKEVFDFELLQWVSPMDYLERQKQF